MPLIAHKYFISLKFTPFFFISQSEDTMKRLVVVLCILVGWAALLLPLLSLAQSEAVRINEVAWAGTNASSADEYVELKGPPGLDLSGWRLAAVDGSPAMTLSGVISTSGFYLLERTDEETVASVPASQLYTGSLEDGGEQLQLKDALGSLVDALDAGAGWPAGDTSPQRAAMERFGDEFLTNDCTHTSGAVDADGNTICGTPGAANQEPQPVNTVRFVTMPQLVAPGESAPFVAQAWNSQGEGPEGSTMRFSIVSSGTQIVDCALDGHDDRLWDGHGNGDGADDGHSGAGGSVVRQPGRDGDQGGVSPACHPDRDRHPDH
jgi:hypothetical protein